MALSEFNRMRAMQRAETAAKRKAEADGLAARRNTTSGIVGGASDFAGGKPVEAVSAESESAEQSGASEEGALAKKTDAEKLGRKRK